VVEGAVLRVVAGPDKGETCPLQTARVAVGTDQQCDLVLSDRSVSRRHVELQVQDAGYLVRDLESTNGTYFRSARIREALLRAGSELRLGAETILRIDPGETRSSVVGARASFGRLVGTSEPMRQVYGILAAVAPTDVTVLIEGETGTGKELIAEELHRQSPRRTRIFSVLDCAALPPNLIESELFGHERGAFTGARTQRIGVFERSRGGMVFLDEIGELPLELQTRLLRVLDKRTVQRVGGNVPIAVDVRLVAATNRSLAEEVHAGRFRRDLYHRLSVVRVVAPPLRKRREDIPLLARHFLLQSGVAEPEAILTPELLAVLTSRRWPGNVRELYNVVQRATVMIDGDAPFDVVDDIGGADVASAREDGASSSRNGDPSRRLRCVHTESFWQQPFKVALDQLTGQFERAYFERLVETHGNNISALARESGIDRHRVRRLLRRRGMYE